MNELKEEFTRLRNEHEANQQRLGLSSPEDVEEYLARLLPIEEFFKRLYRCGETDDFWGFANYFYEKYRFNFQFVDSNISTARHFRYDRHELHSHDFFQINYCYSGNGHIVVDRSESNTTQRSTALSHDEKSSRSCAVVSMRSGDFNLLAPETPHYLCAFEDNCIFIKLYIRKSTFERTFFSWLAKDDILSGFFKSAIRGGKNAYINFRTGGDPEIKRLMLMLYLELMTHRSYFDIISESKLTELFCRLVRDHMKNAETRFDSKKQDGGSARIYAYLHESFRDTSLEAAAKHFGYSKNYLCRMVAKYTGSTFSTLLNEVRISEAKKLLAGDFDSISEVGRSVGYNSDEHFHRIFRELAGCSPREWVAQLEGQTTEKR